METDATGPEERTLSLSIRMLLRLIATVVGTVAGIVLLVGIAYAVISGPLLFFSFWWEIRD